MTQKEYTELMQSKYPVYDMAADRKELENRAEIKDFLMLLKQYNQNNNNDNKTVLDA